MISMPSFAPSASKSHDKGAKREQNPPYSHYNGLTRKSRGNGGGLRPRVWLYSLDDREAEKRILPLAAEVKAGVLTALPFGRARLFRAVRGKDIPDWARGFAESWGHFFLKYLLADPRVTAVIPGTADPAHMTDNLGAMRGPLPDPDQRRQMLAFADAL